MKRGKALRKGVESSKVRFLGPAGWLHIPSNQLQAPVTSHDVSFKCPQGMGGLKLCPHKTTARRGEAALQLEVLTQLHAKGLQPLALGQRAVESLHQGHSLVYAHLYVAEDGGHFVDVLDLLRLFGVYLFWRSCMKLKSVSTDKIPPFDSFNQSFLIRSSSLCTLTEVILVSEAEL